LEGRGPSCSARFGGSLAGELLETRLGAPGLGDYAFQIDRSAVPAMTSDKGATPSDVRVSFLVEVLQLLRQSARVLLLHGFGGRDRWQEWWRQDQRLIAAFLEMDPSGVALDWRYVAGRNSLGTVARDGRQVIYSRAGEQSGYAGLCGGGAIRSPLTWRRRTKGLADSPARARRGGSSRCVSVGGFVDFRSRNHG
jgi:hypothetical protein